MAIVTVAKENSHVGETQELYWQYAEPYNLLIYFELVIIYSTKPLACLEALGMANGTISDGQISASSQMDSSHAANQARLHLKANAGKAGSWSARSNDVNQWLQIDLGSQHTNVIRVATQGRNDFLQWVTKYKLQYSNDGVTFQYYREQGKNADMVKCL